MLVLEEAAGPAKRMEPGEHMTEKALEAGRVD